MKLSFALYVCMAISTAAAGFLGTDDAAKFIPAIWLFYVKGLNTAFGSVALALKAFNSTAYQEWQQKKNGNGNGAGHTASKVLLILPWLFTAACSSGNDMRWSALELASSISQHRSDSDWVPTELKEGGYLVKTMDGRLLPPPATSKE